MPNGKPGDHPLTDLLHHGHEVYGAETDDLIRKIAKLSSQRELHAWWDRAIGWTAKADHVLTEARRQHALLLERAESSGWEAEDEER